MNDVNKPPGDDIADAGSLFEEEPNWGRKPSHAPRSKPAKPAVPEVPIGGGYEVEGAEPEDESPPPPRAPIAPKREAKPRPELEIEEPFAAEPESHVEEVWTRLGEWGPTLAVMGVVAVVVFGLTYVIGSAVGFGAGFLVLVLGLAVLVALSYPIAVTIERPVRMTPEQALKDFYAAASHHFPHFRRMWLLLSDDGKESAEFDSFASFRAYWIRRMAQVRGSRIKKSTPLAFKIQEFRSDKSAGQTVIEAEYTVTVQGRGTEGGPLDSWRIETELVRGPDKMWYLNSGTLPETRAASPGRKRSGDDG